MNQEHVVYNMFTKEQYIKRVPNFLDKYVCSSIVEHFEATEEMWSKGKFYFPNPVEDIDGKKAYQGSSNLSFYETPQTPYIMDKLFQEIKQYQQTYKTKKYWDGWSGYSNLRFNRYKEGQDLRLHADHAYNIFDGERKGIPILAMLMSYNDDYEGGNLVMFEDTEINLKKGELVIFPSNFMYYHKVTPVTKGTRYTGVSWVY